jgi:hypothetical protein
VAVVNDKTTLGPTENEVVVGAAVGKGAWKVHSYYKLSPDIILVDLSKFSVFHLRTGSDNTSPPTSREIKDLMLKE